MSDAPPGRPEGMPLGCDRDREEGEWAGVRPWAWCGWGLAVVVIGLLIWWISTTSTGPSTSAASPGAPTHQIARDGR